MKKMILFAVVFVFLFAAVGTAMAAKPEGNLAGAVRTYAWHLSGEVMPVPPYGSSRDIPGSDTASKLIVNQPNGNTEVTITGVMNGLTPNTTYTVYLSKGYTPYVDTGWNIGNVSEIAISLSGVDYLHITNLTQSGTAITGGTIVYPGYAKQITSGSVIGDHVEIWAVYTLGGSGTLHLTGTIANDGSITGTWTDTWPDEHGPVLRTGDWRNTIGAAVKTHTGDIYWPGLFTSTVPSFTFVTDAYGSGSWHINLKDSDFASSGDHTLSVWINVAGGTMLISDNFIVVSD